MGLATQGYADPARRRTPATALDAARPRDGVDLVILDLGLPDMRGHDLLRTIRASHPDLPVVVLSSRDDEGGKVEALDLGADDYVTKPFGMGELLARLRAALRHQLAVQGERPIFRVDGLSVDLVRRIVKVDDAEVKLTPREYDFLRVLVLHAGKVLTHAQLMQRGLGLVRPAIPARLHAPAPPEAGGRSRAPAHPADRDRRRLPPARARRRAGAARPRRRGRALKPRYG